MKRIVSCSGWFSFLLTTISQLAHSQGTIDARSAAGTKPRIQIGKINATLSDNVMVEFLVANATRLAGPAANPFPLTLTGSNSGFY